MNAVADFEGEKRAAAEAAAELVESGMSVGLGTGSTVAYLLPALAARRLDVRWVTSSPATERAARELGLELQSFLGPEAPNHLDLTIDGADQATPSGWLVKGGGGAHTRDQALAAAAARFVVIISSTKLVHRPEPPNPARAPRLRFGGHTGAAWAGTPPGHAAQPGRRRDRRLSQSGRRPRSNGSAPVEHDWRNRAWAVFTHPGVRDTRGPRRSGRPDQTAVTGSRRASPDPRPGEPARAPANLRFTAAPRREAIRAPVALDIRRRRSCST